MRRAKDLHQNGPSDAPGGARRWRGPAALAMVGALLAAACGGVDPAAEGTGGTVAPARTWSNVTIPIDGDEPQRGGSLRLGLAAETNGWDPTKAQWAGQAYQVARAIFDPLAVADADGQIVPYLAERFEPNADFTTWTITLRPGVTFHDGTPVNADAVATNLEAHRASPLTGQVLTPITEVAVIDDLTVRVSADEPWASFPGYLAAQPGFVASPSMLEDPDGGRNPVGSGPFVFQSWVPNASLQVTRNDYYWQEGQPYVDAVDFVVAVEDTTRVRSFQAGDLDVIELVTTDAATRIRESAEDGQIQLLVDQGSESPEVVIGLNTAQPPFDDVRARRAVAKAIDRETLSAAVFDELLAPATGPLQPGSPYYVETDGQAFDAAEARSLADEYRADTGAPLSFRFVIPPDPGIGEMAQALQSQLREVGIEMTIENKDQAALLADALFGSYEATAFVLFGSGTVEDANVWLTSDNVRPIGEFSLAFPRLASDEIDAALELTRSSNDPTVLAEATADAQEALAEEIPYVFVVETTGVAAASNRVRGFGQTTLPDGEAAIPLDGTTIWLHQLWLEG